VFEEKDHILRMIQRLGRALDRILNGLLSPSEVEIQEVESELSEIAREADFDLELARVLSVDTLSMMMAAEGDVDPSRRWLLAELLYLRGLLADRGGDTAAGRECFERSLDLYRMVPPEWSEEMSLPSPSERIRELETCLSGERVPRSSETT
jgi:hypothetical protein